MNKSLVLFDKNNNLQKNATIVVRFSYEGKDYLVYSVEENEQNSQIFVSRLVFNSEGKCFVDNIASEEKGKLNNIVYNIVILLPSDAQKGNTFESLVNGLSEKFSVKLSLDIPRMDMQEYYSNCSVAITSKILVDTAVKLYEENLNIASNDEPVLVPTWTAPAPVTAPVVVDEPAAVETSNLESVSIPVQESISIPEVNIQTPSIDVVEPVINKIEMPVTAPVEVNSEIALSPVSTVNNENIPEINPQIEKLAIVSDPSLGLGITQPNVAKKNVAGFANTKYIVIGTSCLVLSIAVVVVAFILINNMQ